METSKRQGTAICITILKKSTSQLHQIHDKFGCVMPTHSSFSFSTRNNCSVHEDDIIITCPLLLCPPLQTKTIVETWTGTTSSSRSHTPHKLEPAWRQCRITQVASYILSKIAAPEKTSICLQMQLLALGIAAAVIVTLAVKASMLVAVQLTQSCWFISCDSGSTTDLSSIKNRIQKEFRMYQIIITTFNTVIP